MSLSSKKGEMGSSPWVARFAVLSSVVVVVVISIEIYIAESRCVPYLRHLSQEHG